MRLRVPHGYQPNDYTCGPKSLWMVLRYYKKRIPLKELEQLCHTSKKTGTTRKMMTRVMRDLGFTIHSAYNAHLKDVEGWIKKGIPVIIDFREWDYDITHYAIVVGITKKRIVLHDPEHGSNINVSHEEFKNRWYGKHHTRYTQWLMVAQPTKAKTAN